MVDDQLAYLDSKDAMDIEDPQTSKPGVKRRASRAGTRSVASLTPEQLARKRANDREAQRSIRHRTKTHIEELEQRIRDLSQDQDARNFEQIKRRNTELEEELRRLRELLGRSDGSVTSSPEPTSLSYEARYGMDTLEGVLPLPDWSPQNVGGPGSTYSPFPTSSAGDLLSSFAQDDLGSASGFSDPESAISDVFSDASIGFKGHTSSASVQMTRRDGPISRPQVSRSTSFPHERFGLSSNNQPLRMNESVNGAVLSPLAGQSISPANRSMTMNANGRRHPPPPTSHPSTLHHSKGRTDSTGLPQQNCTTYEVSGPVDSGQARPAWGLFLQFLPPTGPFDSILLGLLQRQRSLATENTPGSLLTGAYHPDLRALVNPGMSNSIHPVISIITNLFQRIEYPGFTDNVASLFLIYHFIQWQILPTMETCQYLPDWYRPRPSQLVTAHPFWTSVLVWGTLRDVVIGDQERYATEEFMNLYLSCITVNWPFRDEDILVFVGDELRVTDPFIRHIETQANWSLNESFQRRYPELRDVCRFS